MNSKDWEKTLKNEACDEQWEALSPAIREIVQRYAFNKALAVMEDLFNCESPIEWALGCALKNDFEVIGFAEGAWVLNPQYEIETPVGKFRVDFMVAADINGGVSLAVECDGHDYHEKTKEQAVKDKRRDRALKLVGCEIIHFTGSEIYKDASQCAREVRKQLEAMANRKGRR